MSKRVCDIYITRWKDDNGFGIWADYEVMQEIAKMEGIVSTDKNQTVGYWSVIIDRRYDLDSIIEEIEQKFPGLELRTNWDE